MDYHITQLDPNAKYIMYLRKSRADNPQETVEEVLSKHEGILQELALRLLGRKIKEEDIFREVGSGETIEDRHEIKVVLSAIESKSIKGVFVVDVQRLSRGDWTDGGKILTAFKYSDTFVITPMMIFNLQRKMDYDYFKSELTRGNDYLEYQKLILNRGRMESIRRGNYIGSIAPYGYKKIVVDKSHTLDIYEPEARAILIASKLRIENNGAMGWTKIAKELDNLGLKPRSGGYWNPYTLRDICINPVNIGMIKWNERKEITVYEEGSLKITRPRNKDIILEKGKHPAIMDQDMYDKLIELEGKNTRVVSKKVLINPLAGLLYCGTCKRAMVYREYKNKDGTIKNAPRLLCSNQSHCGTKSSTFEVIYQSVINTLESLVKEFEIRLKDDETYSTYNMQNKLINDVKKELQDLEKRQDDLYELLETKVYTKDIFLKRNQHLAEERTVLEERLKYLKENTVKPIDYQEKIYQFKDIIKTLKNDEIDAKEKNALLKSVIEKIYYFRNSSNRTKYDTSIPEIKIKLIDF